MPSASSSSASSTSGTTLTNNKTTNKQPPLPVTDSVAAAVASVINSATTTSTDSHDSSNAKVMEAASVIVTSATASLTTAGSKDHLTLSNEPLKMGITYVEHKIRNLEKRKLKLDSYKQEQSQGKELNADQLNAVAKYIEVIQQLDFAREIEKQLTQILGDYSKVMKKQQKKEHLDRASADIDRFKQTLTIQVTLRQLAKPETRIDFMEGTNGALKLTDDQIKVLDELAQLAALDLESLEPTKLVIASEHLVNLIDEKPKPVVGNITYKDAKALLLSLSSCEYFEPTQVRDRDRRKKEQEQIEERQVQVVSSSPVQTFEEKQPPTQILVEPREPTFSFLQESKIKIESPHMDPAVVAVSQFAPPLMSHPIAIENKTNIFNALKERPTLMGSPMGPVGHMDEMKLTNLTVKDEEGFEEWAVPSVTSNTEWGALQDSSILKSDDVESNDQEGDGHNYRRGGRGTGYRGVRVTRATSMNNGYRGSSAPPGRGHQNGKNGSYIGDRRNNDVFDRRSNERFDRGDNHFGDFPEIDMWMNDAATATHSTHHWDTTGKQAQFDANKQYLQAESSGYSFLDTGLFQSWYDPSTMTTYTYDGKICRGSEVWSDEAEYKAARGVRGNIGGYNRPDADSNLYGGSRFGQPPKAARGQSCQFRGSFRGGSDGNGMYQPQ